MPARALPMRVWASASDTLEAAGAPCSTPGGSDRRHADSNHGRVVLRNGSADSVACRGAGAHQMGGHQEAYRYEPLQAIVFNATPAGQPDAPRRSPPESGRAAGVTPCQLNAYLCTATL